MNNTIFAPPKAQRLKHVEGPGLPEHKGPKNMSWIKHEGGAKPNCDKQRSQNNMPNLHRVKQGNSA